ncbi:MAG: Lrp/AsnC ligand binding domain-containing protein [Thaumarchaeota archaeon]|nr:Lrp/AsnC ligand binding domain-containing protein [Nitrososphaerota archaeon]
MERAIVLINATPGGEDEVLKDLRSEKAVRQVYQLYGLYDLLAVVEGEDDHAVKAIISNRFRGHPKVASTLTMKVLNST